MRFPGNDPAVGRAVSVTIMLVGKRCDDLIAFASIEVCQLHMRSPAATVEHGRRVLLATERSVAVAQKHQRSAVASQRYQVLMSAPFEVTGGERDRPFAAFLGENPLPYQCPPPRE